MEKIVAEDIIISGEDSFIYDDSYKMFLRDIKDFTVLSKEETESLIIEAQNGNKEAKTKLVQSNLKLVVYVANTYKNRLGHMKFLDIIQEGVIGLINSINGYDSEKGAFSTYAVYWIKQAISHALAYKNEEIRRPVNVQNVISKYNKIVNECLLKGEKLPDNDTISKMLGITPESLMVILDMLTTNTFSLDDVVDWSTDDIGYEEVIGFEDAAYNRVLEDMSQLELFAVIKKVLNPKEYYIVYNRYLSDERKKLEVLADLLLVTRERVRQIEHRALRKIKPYMDKNGSLYKTEIANIKSRCNIELYNVNPISPYNIVSYLFVQEHLNKEERKVLYSILFDSTYSNDREIREKSKFVYDKAKDFIQQNITKFNEFYHQTIDMYRGNLFELIDEILLNDDMILKRI